MGSKFQKFIEKVNVKKRNFAVLISTFLFLQTSSYSKLTGGGLAAPIIDKVNEWRQDLFILGCVLVAMGILMAVISNYMDTNFGHVLDKVVKGMILVAVVTFIPQAIELAGGATLNTNTIETANLEESYVFINGIIFIAIIPFIPLIIKFIMGVISKKKIIKFTDNLGEYQ